MTDTTSDNRITRVEISTSPRMTWLWAPDETTAQRIRTILGGAGTPAQRGGQPIPQVTDVGIGVAALEACETLAANGFTFAWHESVHPLNRDGWPATLPGMNHPPAGQPH
jgi:hypothetical protein